MTRPERSRPVTAALSSRWARLLLVVGVVGAVGAVAADQLQSYVPADEGARPAKAGTEILPEKFLRGYDPITVYFSGNVGPGKGPADDPSSLARIRPAWPGAWSWLDKRTLQFRPGEPWPALQRFSVEAQGTRAVLSTMMTAPTSMQPAEGSDSLRPFRTITLTFPQALPIEALKQMIRLEVRDLPGLADSSRKAVEHFTIADLPRASQKDPAGYAITFDDEIAEGKQLVVSLALALGEEGKALWSARVATRLGFHLEEVTCGADRLEVKGAPKAQKETALDCGSAGQTPQLVFSAAPSGLTLTQLKKLVRLEPAVPDLRFSLFGKRVQLDGKFVPDTLYRMRLGASPITDAEARKLDDPGDAEVYFFLGWKKPFLRLQRGQALVEQNGPRTVPLVGYGEPRADVRIYKIDPKHTGLWPFPEGPVVIQEEAPPPFPGEEPSPTAPMSYVTADALAQHVRLLGSPLVSRVVELPLLDKSGTTTFGLDVGKALDDVVGARQPGTYLVGVRRLQGAPERAYMRVTVTNLSLTVVEERGQAVFFVRSLDKAEAVPNARITLEVVDEVPDPPPATKTKQVPDRVVLTTDAEGRASLAARPRWVRLQRILVEKGDDVLALDPRTAPPRFFANHWSSSGDWLSVLTNPVPPPVNDRSLGFLLTERPIYRPGEKVFLKGFARDKRGGALQLPNDPLDKYSLKVTGPGGEEWVVPTTSTALYAFDGVWEASEPPTGNYTARLLHRGEVLATRTFKVEPYRVPTFEVQLSGPRRARLDAPFSVQALARYYAGGSVAHEKIRWSVTRFPHHYVPVGREGFLFASSSQFARPEARPKDERTERAGELSDDGIDKIEINPALDIDGSPRLYRFEATVTGADDQEVTAVTDVVALPPFSIGMKLTRYAKQALQLEPEIIAVGVDDKLLGGQKVGVRLYKRSWHSHLRESQFATGQASYVTEQEDKQLAEVEVVTDGKQPVKAKLPVAEAGVYVVEISARDKLGRLQTLSADLYVGGKEPVAWQKQQAGVFELVPDKTEYRPGEVAHVVVKSPFVRAKALVVVEEALQNRYSFFDIENGQGTIDVPIAGTHTPNLPVHVALMRGRLGESVSDDAPNRPQTAAASTELKVLPTKNTVQVGLAHKDSARPGSKLDMTVTLKDDGGKPLAGEVTLWLVDEAVLALAPEQTRDPLTAFVVQNVATASLLDTRNLAVGRIIDDDTPGGDGTEDEQSGMPKRRVRKNFQTVPYWQATLQVPVSGKLVVPIQLSDDLTNFAVRAVAVAGAERFGDASSVIKVRLPVLVQPQLPRFVRMGDRFDGGGVARLVEGAEGPGRVTFELGGPAEGAGKKQTQDIALTEKKAASVTFPVVTKSLAGRGELVVKVDVTRLKDGVGDAFEVKLPVLPDRSVEHELLVDKWTPGDRTLPPIAEAARPGTLSTEVLVTSVPGLLEAFAALEYNDEYPYGCLEQKMSKLGPQLAMAELAKVLGADMFGAQVKPQIKRLVDEMALHQAEDGLFALWPGTTGSVQLTADAIDFATLAQSIGVELDQKVKARAIDALRRSLRSDYAGNVDGYRFNQQSAALRALFVAGNYDESYLTDLLRTRSGMDVTSRGELVLAMARRRAVFASDLDKMKTELWGTMVFKLDRGTRVFVGLSDPRRDWGGQILGSSTSSLAIAERALLEIDPKNADHEVVIQGILQRGAAGRGFGSTYDNREVVKTLIAYLGRADVGRQKTTTTFSAGPAKIAALSIDDKPKVARTSFLHDGAVTVTVAGDPVRARVRRSYLPSTPGDRVGALQSGFVVQRSMTILPQDGSAERRVEDQKGGERELAVGDVVEVHATMVVDQARANLALVVPFAAGFEPLNPALSTASSEAQPSQRDSVAATYVERLDHEVRYFFSSLPKGSYSFHFRLKAITPGSYVHPAPYAELMYNDTVRGRGDGMRVIVKRVDGNAAPAGGKGR